MDQAGTLRKIMHGRSPVKSEGLKSLKVISVTSGKGGVGKTNIVANLAVTMQRQGMKVLLLDGDFGLANLNIVMGLETKGTVSDIISGAKDVSDIIVTGPSGVKLIPSSSGILKASQLSLADKTILMDRLESARIPFDVLLIDTGAGINSDVTYLNAAASEVVVVTTPEPTAITDAYALMKVMSQEHKVKRFRLLVNMAQDEREATTVFSNLLDVADKFLNVTIEYLGWIPFDRRVSQAVMGRKILCDRFPDAPAVKAFESIATELAGPSNGSVSPAITGNLQFFWRTLMINEVNA
jgi:flagellar biosynthesis protein FlhG